MQLGIYNTDPHSHPPNHSWAQAGYWQVNTVKSASHDCKVENQTRCRVNVHRALIVYKTHNHNADHVFHVDYNELPPISPSPNHGTKYSQMIGSPGLPSFIVLCLLCFRGVVIFHKWKARPSNDKKITTCFIAVVWN